jgi:serine phosphatase RsbU (regulator of sigma subunit)
VPRSPEDTQATLVARRILRELAGALGLSVVLLAAMLAAVLVADRNVVAALGVLTLATGIGISILVLRRATAAALARNAALDQERRGREQLARTLEATRRLVAIDAPKELHEQICVVAREVFECSAVSLWRVEAEHMVLLARVPFQDPYEGSDRRTIAELPGLGEAFAAARPLFVEDMRSRATGITQVTAEILGTGSLFNVPISIAGITEMSLVLTWNEILPEPGETQRLAAERFADQAGLVLEQSLHRAAEAEIASLNRTLQRMVETAPLFNALGSSKEVAEAVCREALDIFEATGAALWLETGDGIELVMRVPTAPIFAERQRILFAEHPQFAEDLSAGQPRFIEDIEYVDPVLWERFARHSNSRSQLRLPLASAGQARALIVLSWSGPVAPPSARVAAIASRFADQAGMALAEARRREAQREASELHARFEQSLLPSISLASRDAGAATFYRPGDARLSLGGDFYDCLELPDGAIALLIGDVAGHGAAAAALGASLRSAWRALVLGDWRLEDLPGGLQAVCVRERHDQHLFVTAITARIEAHRGSLRFVSAGHPAPLVVGTSAAGAQNGPPLGVVGDASWQVNEVPLTLPASILLYTDGLVEGRAAPGSSERLGIEPVERRLRGVVPGELGEDELAGLVELATTANGSGLPDDVALLALNLRA